MHPPPQPTGKKLIGPPKFQHRISTYAEIVIPILKRIARTFARCCEQKIVFMSESMSQLRFTLV